MSEEIETVIEKDIPEIGQCLSAQVLIVPRCPYGCAGGMQYVIEPGSHGEFTHARCHIHTCPAYHHRYELPKLNLVRVR